MAEEKIKKRSLTPEQRRILIKKETEKPFTGKLLYNKETGSYLCAQCGNPLFSSSTKYDSGSGWPSFWDVKSDKSVRFQEDNSLGIRRTEVLCKLCGGHLGHVFPDGPREKTGKRYCINSSALSFQKSNPKKRKKL